MCSCGKEYQNLTNNITKNTEEKRKYYEKLLDNTNIVIFQCYSIFLKKNSYHSNIGLYFSGIIAIIEVILIIVLAFKGISTIIFHKLYSHESSQELPTTSNTITESSSLKTTIDTPFASTSKNLYSRDGNFCFFRYPREFRRH